MVVRKAEMRLPFGLSGRRILITGTSDLTGTALDVNGAQA
jgi:hypothetical protein